MVVTAARAEIRLQKKGGPELFLSWMTKHRTAQLTVEPACGGVFRPEHGGRGVAADVREAPELVLGGCEHLLV